MMDASMLARASNQSRQKQNSQESSSPTPPPAYTPRHQTGFHLLAQLQQTQSQSSTTPMERNSPPMIGRPPLTTILDEVDDDEADFQEGVSPICLRINTSIAISKDNNLICLSDTPASHANAIAKAVVQAIQENSSGQCGIPMIDEEGRPRPVKIEVDAGITIDGANNVIGNQDIINRVLNSRKRLRTQEDEESSQGEHANTALKRPCRRGTDD